jgi:CubicO group peptidase (beta-lactamase class C family)
MPEHASGWMKSDLHNKEKTTIHRRIQSEFGEVRIDGFCAPKFNTVLDTFENNFLERGELGASVCVTQNGTPVVDLWGGLACAETRAPWTRDTIALVYSSTKGAAAICVHRLAAKGLIDLDAPVAQYWPEFGQNGKEQITVNMVLSHQSGLVHWQKKLKEDALTDWDYMIKACEEEEPFWMPGLRHGYHASSFGFLCGELVRRVTGKSIGAFFQDELVEPLGIEFWIGLPARHDTRVATMVMPGRPAEWRPAPDVFAMSAAVPDSLPGLMFNNDGGWARHQHSRAFRAAEIPSVNGYTHARGLAGLYAPLACGGKLDDFELVDRNTLARMGAVASAGYDEMLLIPTRFGLGFMKSFDNRCLEPAKRDSLVISEEAFGHAGFGGSIGLADPAAQMSFGYVMNRLAPVVIMNPRGQSLVDATYRSLGYRSNSSGRWAE